jgi:CHASE3 domain sensor protein
MYRRALSRRTLFAPIALLLVLAAMTVFLTLNHFAATRQTKERVLHSHEVIEAALITFSHVQDVESGSRGMLSGGDPAYLDNFDVGVAQFPTSAAELLRLLKDNPQQHERADQLVKILGERVNIAVARIELARAGRLADAKALRVGAGKRAMDHARVILAELIREEKRLLAERSTIAERDERKGVVIALSVSALAALGLGFLILALYRANRGLGLQIQAREA